MSPGELIRSQRKRHRLTQTRLAVRAGTSQNAISRIERDELSPSVATLARLLTVMGERLDLHVNPLPGSFDSDHLADSLQQTMDERLERSLAWNRFGAQIAGVARTARR